MIAVVEAATAIGMIAAAADGMITMTTAMIETTKTIARGVVVPVGDGENRYLRIAFVLSQSNVSFVQLWQGLPGRTPKPCPPVA